MTIGIKAPGYYVQGNGELDKLGKYVKKMGNSFDKVKYISQI